MGVCNALLIMLALLGAELQSTSVALQLELLDDAIQRQLGYSNRLMLHTEARGKTVTHVDLITYALPHVVLPATHRSLRFRWMTRIWDERDMMYVISHGESPGSRPISPAVNVSFNISREGKVPKHYTEFMVNIHCTAPSVVPERFTFNILAYVPGRQDSRFLTVFNMQKKCPVTPAEPLPPLVRKQLCKRLCKKPKAKKLERLTCKQSWVLFAAFTGKNQAGDDRQTLHFTDSQPHFKTALGNFIKSERYYGNATATVPAELSVCNCVKNLKSRKKYALFAVGEWDGGNLSDLSLVAEQSLLLRKLKVRKHLRNVECSPQ